MLLIPQIFRQFPQVIAAQSTRNGGVSRKPFDSLNLGLSTKDDKELVLRNRELFFSAAQIPSGKISLATQVHGAEILKVSEPVISSNYDALITNRPDNFLAVSVADCVPVLIYDSKQKVVAAVHAGWKGTALGIVEKTLQRMKLEYNTQGEDCYAFIGACISYDAFEVGEEVAVSFDGNYKRYDRFINKYFVDLKSVNKSQLRKSGVLEKNIEVSGYCTVENNDLFFSHRKEKGQTGRMLAVIGMKAVL